MRQAWAILAGALIVLLVVCWAVFGPVALFVAGCLLVLAGCLPAGAAVQWNGTLDRRWLALAFGTWAAGYVLAALGIWGMG